MGASQVRVQYVMRDGSTRIETHTDRRNFDRIVTDWMKRFGNYVCIEAGWGTICGVEVENISLASIGRIRYHAMGTFRDERERVQRSLIPATA